MKGLPSYVLNTLSTNGRSIWWKTWFGLTMILSVSPPYHDAMPILPYSHLSQQNLADNGRAKNKVNPTKVYEQIPHPV